MKIGSRSRKMTPAIPVFIADCTGDNAGDSVGPTADGFETTALPASRYHLYTRAVMSLTARSRSHPGKTDRVDVCHRFLMDFCSGLAYFVNQAFLPPNISKKEFDFEEPLIG